MDITRFKELKQKKLFKLKKVGDQVACESKLFDPITGEEATTQVNYLSVDALEKEKLQLEERLDAINELLGDIDEVLSKKE